MSQAEHYAMGLRFGLKGMNTALVDRIGRERLTAGGKHYPVPGGMLETAENLRAEYGISRQAQDALAYASHRRAVAAHEDGRFADELVPIEVPGRRGAVVVDRDEHPRADASLEQALRAGLRAVRAQQDPESTVTAGNSSGQNDGAAVAIVTTRDKAAALGLRPLAPIGVVGGGRGGALAHGDRPGSGHRPGAEACRAGAGRRRSDRTQRGLRRAGPGVHHGARPVRGRPGSGQCERLRDLAGASGGCHRRADSRHAACANSIDARRGYGVERCASAAGRAWPRSSSG